MFQWHSERRENSSPDCKALHPRLFPTSFANPVLFCTMGLYWCGGIGAKYSHDPFANPRCFYTVELCAQCFGDAVPARDTTPYGAQSLRLFVQASYPYRRRTSVIEKIELLPLPDMTEINALLKTIEAQIGLQFGTVIFKTSHDGKIEIIPPADFYRKE